MVLGASLFLLKLTASCFLRYVNNPYASLCAKHFYIQLQHNTVLYSISRFFAIGKIARIISRIRPSARIEYQIEYRTLRYGTILYQCKSTIVW